MLPFFDCCFSMTRNALPSCLFWSWHGSWTPSAGQMASEKTENKPGKSQSAGTTPQLSPSFSQSKDTDWMPATYQVGAGKIKEISYDPCPWNPPIWKLPIAEDCLCIDSRKSIHSLPRKDNRYVFMLGYENNLHLCKSGTPFYNAV